MTQTWRPSLCLSVLTLLFSALNGQNSTVNITVDGLAAGDVAALTLERGVGGLFDATVIGQGVDVPVPHSFEVEAGPWMLSLATTVACGSYP